ncbi:FHA domain-containing protein [Pontiellaceae bacterium B12227]|nr:FHA domain-containing protein [Pontiellaceae bacterium B12227]
MSHLIIEQGEAVGTEVSIPKDGMKFGRSPANDLELKDESVMLFHGRFFFKSDGSLWVTDFGAGEKTVVDGVAIDEYQLKVGDLVEVGKTAFRIINLSIDSEEDPPPKAPVPVALPVVQDDVVEEAEEIDLGFKAVSAAKKGGKAHKKAHEKESSFTHRITQVLISLVVVGVLIYVAMEAMKLSDPVTPNVAPHKKSFSLSYERVVGNEKNIYRYKLDLDQNRHLKVIVDDLKGNRHITEERVVSEPVILQLASQIDEAGFFEVDADRIGISENQYDLHDLTVQSSHWLQRIKVLNRRPPLQIKRTIDLIDDFALSEAGILTSFFKSQEELLVMAKLAFDRAETKYREREIRTVNYALAIKNYRDTVFFLETIDNKPAYYEKAEARLEEVSEMRDQRYDDLMFQTEQAIRLKEWETAERHLKKLTELIPERSDDRYDTIRSKMLNVERYLR